MMEGCEMVGHLVGRVAGGYEKNLIQAKLARRDPRRLKVPGMDGVERSAKNRDIQER